MSGTSCPCFKKQAISKCKSKKAWRRNDGRILNDPTNSIVRLGTYNQGYTLTPLGVSLGKL